MSLVLQAVQAMVSYTQAACKQIFPLVSFCINTSDIEEEIEVVAICLEAVCYLVC